MWAFTDAAALELRVAKINSDINAAMKAARDDRRRRERGLLLSELPAELLRSRRRPRTHTITYFRPILPKI